ncbi:hypothetical protein ABIC89_000394 [Variovorax boronicumulans]|uniref:hypothetical protein n=1 Tax=Variovorax boronicumulans TaxID=436515 RepID=UPI003398AA8D
MTSDGNGLGADFDQWKRLADELTEALAALERGESGARERVNELSLALRLRNDLPFQHALY